jgi:L1 cell adhesion molecule like protein
MRVKAACEKAKWILSSAVSADMFCESFHEGEDFSVVFTWAKFEELCLDLFKKCMTPVENALRDAQMAKD